MRLLSVEDPAKGERNFKVTLECMSCKATRVAWNNNYMRGLSPCQFCKSKRTGKMSAIGTMRPYMVVSEDTLTISWPATPPMLKAGERLFKAVDSEHFKLCTVDLGTHKPMPASELVTPIIMAPQPPELPPPEPQTIYRLHLVVPQLFMRYYLGSDETHADAAQTYYDDRVEPSDRPPDLTAGETSTWTKDGVEYAYLYFKDSHSCLK